MYAINITAGQYTIICVILTSFTAMFIAQRQGSKKQEHTLARVEMNVDGRLSAALTKIEEMRDIIVTLRDMIATKDKQLDAKDVRLDAKDVRLDAQDQALVFERGKNE